MEKERDGKHRKERIKTLTNLLRTTIRHHDKVLDKKGPKGTEVQGNIWRTNPLPFDAELRKKKKFSKVAKKLREEGKEGGKFVAKIMKSQTEEESWEHFNRLCSGFSLQPEEARAKLRCG